MRNDTALIKLKLKISFQSLSLLTDHEYGREKGHHDGYGDGQHAQLAVTQQHLVVGVLATEGVEGADHEGQQQRAAEHAVVDHAERLSLLSGIHLATAQD